MSHLNLRNTTINVRKPCGCPANLPVGVHSDKKHRNGRKEFTLTCRALKIKYTGSAEMILSTYGDSVPTLSMICAMKLSDVLMRKWRYDATLPNTHVWKLERVK